MAELNLDKTRKFLLTHLGLDYSKKREQELYAKLGKAAKEFNFTDTYKFLDWLLRQQLSEEQVKLLANSLTIGETYFFREQNALDYIKQVYLPDLIRQRKGNEQKLRIWSAGCATGEEPYSLAIILQQTIPDIKNWDITILATDINSTFLSKAKKGVYSNWSFRKTQESFQKGYFKKIDKNNYQIVDSIKSMVSFSHLNLAADIYPSPQNNTHNYDIILCRNVLIYFALEGVKTVTQKFYKSLNVNGLFVVSPVETSNLLTSSFSTVSYKGNTFFKKDPLEKLKSKNGLKKNLSKKIVDSKSFISNLHLKVNSKKSTIQALPKAKDTTSQKTKRNPKCTSDANENKSYELAFENFNLGKFEEAEKLLKEIAIEANGNKADITLLRAKIYAGKNQLDKSEKWCKKTLALDKINIDTHYLLATIYSEQEKTEEAIQSLNKILFLDSNFILTHFLLGNLYLKQEDVKVSFKHFENAVKCLVKLEDNEIVRGSEGMSAGGLRSIIESIKENKNIVAF